MSCGGGGAGRSGIGIAAEGLQGAGIAVGGIGGRVHGLRLPDGLQGFLRGDLVGVFADVTRGGNGHQHEDEDDGDDDEQLHQGEAVLPTANAGLRSARNGAAVANDRELAIHGNPMPS